MRLLTRYILTEFLKVFLISLSGITLMVVLAIVGQEAIRKVLGPANMLRLVPYALPIALLYAIPATTLFAACSVFGRVSSDNEVAAIKSSGISPVALIWPAIALSFLLSVLVVGLNDLAVTWGREGLKRVVLESVEQIAYSMLRTNRSYRSRRFSITVKRVDGHRLIRPTLTFHAAGDRQPTVIMAEEAELWANLDENALSISLVNSEVDDDSARVIWPGQDVIHVPLSDAVHKTNAVGRPTDVALRRIPAEVDRQHTEIKRIEQSLAAEAAYELLTGDFESLTSQAWGARHTSLAQARIRLHRLHTEPWRRWANGFSCLAFVLVGAPLAIRLRNADVWTTFGLCFGVLLLVYYPLLAYGVAQAKSGELPPYCVWLGNAVVLLVGLWLIKQVLRH